jgi:regulator of cell morphogenesis and NO signaling
MLREITPDLSVGRIAASHPDLIPELERLGIDYCCSGSRSLSEAVSRIGGDPAAVAAHLARYPGEPITGRDGPDCAAMSMTELADHIEQTHHANARAALLRIGTLIDQCAVAHAEEDPRLEALRQTFTALRDDMHDHFNREERVLFPWLRRLDRRSEITSGPPWSVRRPIDCMVHDHDDVGEAFACIRDLTDDLTPPDSACPTWKACYRALADFEHDTRLHIHKENNILFPAGIEAEARSGSRRHAPPAVRM